MESYKQKNITYFTDNNEPADKLLCILEADNCLSESIKAKISSMVYCIIHDQGDKEKVIALIDNMKWLTIFSEEFLSKIERLLMEAIEHEKK